jgi:hypothetical protein
MIFQDPYAPLTVHVTYPRHPDCRPGLPRLRRMGAGERVNDQVDWVNVAYEIEGVGHSEPQENASLLTVL